MALWLSQENIFNDYNDNTQLTMIATERRSVLDLFSIDMDIATSLDLFYQIIANYENGVYGALTAYVYYFDNPGDGMQPVFVGFLEPAATRYPVYVKLSKTLEGSSGYYGGAIFGIYVDSACTNKLDEITSSELQWSASQELLITTETATLYVKEISSGSASVSVNSGIFAVNVDTNVNGTAEAAAVVVGDGADGTILNFPPPPAPPGGPNVVLQKVDALTGGALAGATFRFEGNAASGNYMSFDLTTDSDGVIIAQWLDPAEPDYIEPGEYTVTEVSAPPGFEPSSESRHLSLWLVYISDGDYYEPHKSGTLLFENYQKHTVVLRKLSADVAPLNGAVFSVYRNGTFLQSLSTAGGGTITLTDIETGYYEFVETSPPPGFLLSAKTSVGVYVDAMDMSTTTHYLTMTNYEYPEIVIQKLDAVTNRPLAGATFEVKIDGAVFGTFTTTSTGRLIFNYAQYKDFLTDGNEIWTVTVTEVSAPDGYFDAEPLTQTNQLQKGQALSHFTFENQPHPNVVVYKTDGKTALPLAGAVFTLVGVDNANSFVAVTGDDGIATFAKVPVGTYSLSESTAPGGYIASADVKTVVVRADGTTELRFEFENLKKPSLTVYKYDADTAEPLANAEFSISHKGGAVVYEGMTNSDGYITLPPLEPGWYTITEMEPPPGYLILTKSRDVLLVAGEDLEVKVDNKKKPTLTVYKYDVNTAAPLANAEFSIAHKGGAVVHEGLTNSDGYITLPLLEPGWYTITEMEPPLGYLILTKSRDVLLVAGEDLEVKVDNVKCPTLTVYKTDSITGDALSGVKFNVQYSPDVNFTGGVVNLGDFPTDANGTILLNNNLGAGWYRVTEIAPPAGYIIGNPSVQDIFLAGGNNKALYFENTPKSAIVVRKIDSDTRLPVQGATFQIRYLGGTSGSGGTIIKTAVTSINGTFTATGLAPGTYVVEEIIPAPGYELSNPSVQTAYITDDEQCVVELMFENPAMGELIILKLDSVTKQPLKGAKFKLTDSSGEVIGPNNSLYTTDASGVITIAEYLEIGSTVIVQEVSAPDGYVLDTAEQSVKIKENTTHTLTFYNTPKGALIIEKRDAVTNEPLAGAEFKVTTSSGELVAQAGGVISSNGIYKTNANGQIHITLLDEDTYVVTETKAPDGYIFNTDSQTVKVNPNDTQTLTFYNTPKSGLQIVKIDSETKQPIKGAKFTIYKKSGDFVGEYETDGDGIIIVPELDNGWYKIVETRAPSGYVLDDTPKDVEMKGNQFLKVTFENTPMAGMQILKLDEETRRPIAGVEFRVAKMNGEIIDTYTTDVNGLIRIPVLDAGWYAVTETKSAKGYLADDIVHNIEVKDGKNTLLTVTNKKASGILLHKVDSATGKGIYGVQFLLSDSNNNPICQLVSDQDGWVYIGIDEQLPAGKYFLRELKPAEGYIGDDEIKTIYLEAGKTTEITWKNTAITGQIQVVKYSEDYNPITDAAAGSLLKGAVFEITQARSGAVVGYITTDARGVAASPALPLGRYFVKEVTAAPYTQLNPERFEAELEYAGQIIRLAVYNKSAALGTEIKKTGNLQVLVGESMWYNLAIKNTSNVPLTDFYWSDRIPTDAVRVQTLVTGTYNLRLYYRALYKTNMGEWRVLANNLLTTNSYSFSLHTNALGLMNGEYVTEVKLEFGTVPAGFASVTSPMIAVQTFNTLANKYQIINRAYVGGKYLEAPQESTSSWVTEFVRLDKPTPAPNLPKTGY